MCLTPHQSCPHASLQTDMCSLCFTFKQQPWSCACLCCTATLCSSCTAGLKLQAACCCSSGLIQLCVLQSQCADCQALLDRELSSCSWTGQYLNLRGYRKMLDQDSCLYHYNIYGKSPNSWQRSPFWPCSSPSFFSPEARGLPSVLRTGVFGTAYEPKVRTDTAENCLGKGMKFLYFRKIISLIHFTGAKTF